MQRTADETEATTGDPSSVETALRSPGQPLDELTRAHMERHLGHDFRGVRIHADAQAAASARALNAVAYTVGRDVVFDAGAYQPRSSGGRELLAHELAHVVQQSRGAVSGRANARGLVISDPGDAFERQADAMAAGLPHASPAPLPATAPARAVVQRRAHAVAPARGARVPAIVDDGQPTVSGQMQRTPFLDALHASLSEGVDAEFRRGGRPGRDCPYILRTIARYRGRSAAQLMRVIAAFARPAPGIDARGIIAAVTARARVVARRISERDQRRAQAATVTGGPTLPAHEPAAIRAQLGIGRALDRGTRDRMEQAFGVNFSAVRVHDDPTAERFNAALGARAFTIGRNIAFSPGQYAPGTPRGDRLLAHELAHTVQQGPAAAGAVGGEAPALEREADRAADAAVGGDRRVAAQLSTIGGPRVQRAPAVVAGALIIAEATPEIIVVSEVAAVSAEVVVADTAIVAAVDVAAPTVLELAAPVGVEMAAPAVVEAVAPAAISSAAPTAATVAVAAAATQLSSDSEPYSSEDDDRTPRQRCFEINPFAMMCDNVSTSAELMAAQFIVRQGYPASALGECSPFGKPAGPGKIFECNGAPGQSWHCPVAGSPTPVSIFGCLCCAEDGSTSYQWEGAHWSVNLSRRGQ